MEFNLFENNSENSLVEIIGNKIVVSSRQVAQNFEKRHTHVLDSIKQLINSAEKSAQWFYKNTYKDSSGKTNIEYLMEMNLSCLLTAMEGITFETVPASEIERMKQSNT